MIGDLLASFCERGEGGGTQCLELWTYPDQTLNVVATRVYHHEEAEFAFPCAPHQVMGVLAGARAFRSEIPQARLFLERVDDQVRASIEFSEGGWQQYVPVESFESALESCGLSRLA